MLYLEAFSLFACHHLSAVALSFALYMASQSQDEQHQIRYKQSKQLARRHTPGDERLPIVDQCQQCPKHQRYLD